MKVICINSKNRPDRIPVEKWIKEGEIYTVVNAMLMNIQVNKVGVQLAEIDLGEDCFPYNYFDADRFKELTKDAKKELEASLALTI
jgi:hypothetical protein